MNVNSCIPYSWTWCPAGRRHAPALRMSPRLRGSREILVCPCQGFTWFYERIIRAFTRGRPCRAATDSPLFSRLNILSDAERERCRNRGRGIYTMEREVIYVCRDADLGNRIAAPRPLVDERYILIERRTKWEEWIETIRGCAHRALFRTPDLREKERRSNAARGRGTRAREANVGIEGGKWSRGIPQNSRSASLEFPIKFHRIRNPASVPLLPSFLPFSPDDKCRHSMDLSNSPIFLFLPSPNPSASVPNPSVANPVSDVIKMYVA